MRTATILGLAATLLVVGACSQPVGYVNMRRVFDDSQAGKAAKAEIDRATATAKKAAEEAKADLENAAGPLSEVALAEKRQRAERLAADYRQAVNREDEKERDAFFDMLGPHVDRVAADRRVGLVIALFGEPLHRDARVDITADVIRRLDAEAGRAPVASADPVKLKAENERLRAELTRQKHQ